MDKLIFNPVATMNEQALIRQGLVNELANVSTVGFKRSFDAALQSVKAVGDGFDSRHQTQLLMSETIDMNPGTVMATGRDLDIAMGGATVMGVQSFDGELAFTRRGDLRVNVNGALETGVGHVVLGANGPITIPPGFGVRIDKTGGVFAQDFTQPGAPVEQFIDQILLRDASAQALTRREDGLFKPVGLPDGTDFASGLEVPVVTSQMLEGSNVSPITAMTKLIDHARTFEAQLKIIKEAKDLDGSGASMMKQS
jgi:flagellar basal-body rod protein FlgF